MINAQRMGDSIIRESKQKAAEIIRSANIKAEDREQRARDDVELVREVCSHGCQHRVRTQGRHGSLLQGALAAFSQTGGQCVDARSMHGAVPAPVSSAFINSCLSARITA